MEEEGPKILDVGSGFATLDCSQRFAQFDHILIYILIIYDHLDSFGMVVFLILVMCSH